MTRLVSFVWSLGEAIFFFLVPDIWLSRIVLKDRKEAYLNIAFSAAGALIGGALLYYLAQSHFATLKTQLAIVPAVSPTMIEGVGQQIEQIGLGPALFHGMITGIPYKLFASWSGHLQLSFASFLMVSLLMRSVRFLVVTALVHGLSTLARNRISLTTQYWLHGCGWTAFYAFYFYKFGFL